MPKKMLKNPKIQKNPKKIQKIQKNPKNPKKSVHLIWQCKTPPIQCINPFLFIKSSYAKKNVEKSKNPKKSKKNPKNPKKSKKSKKIRTPYLGVNNPSILKKTEY